MNNKTAQGGHVIMFVPESGSGQKVAMLCALLKLRCHLVGEDGLWRTPVDILNPKAEQIASVPEAAAANAGTERREPLLLFCGLSNAVLDQFLGELKKRGIRIPLKAVLTESNAAWPLSKLYTELKGEHSLMTGEAL